MGDGTGEPVTGGSPSDRPWDDAAHLGVRGAWTDRPRSAIVAPDFRRPPGFLFHLALLVPTAGLLYAASTPGLEILVLMGSVIGLGVGAIIWAVRAFAFATDRTRRRRRRQALWFAAAPLCGAAVLAIIVADLPLRARWSMARNDFNAALELVPDMPTDPVDPVAPHTISDPVSFQVPGRIGTYAVERASRIEAGVLFHIGGSGIGFSDGGFAHVPGGPPGGLGPHDPSAAFGKAWFETITFRHLDGDWYVWDAVR